MKNHSTTYSCDKCGKKLKGTRHEMNIRTSLQESSAYWSRLHIQIIHRHGVHNTATEEKAELCQSCVIELLNDALKRVKNGERATAGTESIEQENWT